MPPQLEEAGSGTKSAGGRAAKSSEAKKVGGIGGWRREWRLGGSWLGIGLDRAAEAEVEAVFVRFREGGRVGGLGMGLVTEGGEWGLWGKGRRRKGDTAAAEEMGWRNWSMRGRRKGEEETEGRAKGAAGIPVNSWTMARKLEVSVVSTVVGARREARDRFLEFRGGGAAGGSACASTAAVEGWLPEAEGRSGAGEEEESW